MGWWPCCPACAADSSASVKSVHKTAASVASQGVADSATEVQEYKPGLTWQEQALQKWQADLFGPGGRYQKLLVMSNDGDEQTVLARDRSNKERVLIRLLEHSSPKISEREVLNHRGCSHHPNVIKFRAVHVTLTQLAVVTEHADMGTLADYLATQRQQPGFQGQIERRVRPLFQQLVMALAFCHAKGVSNRSITLESLLLASPRGKHSKPVVKLWDFGLSKDLRLDSTCKTACGTAEYLAPEVLLYTEYDGAQADMWSLGISLYAMLTGEFCFAAKEDAGLVPAAALQAMFHRILAARFEVPRTLSRPCRHLLRGLICADVDRRKTVHDVLRHPWFLHGLSEGAVERNQRLAELPLEALTLSSPQSEQDIMSIVQAAKHAPRPEAPPVSSIPMRTSKASQDIGSAVS